jgi:cytochrome c peroxidase
VARNAPTVYNAAMHISQFWDGRAADVEEQAQGPILAAGEMGMPNPDYVVRVLKSIPGYLPLFQAAFPGEVDPINYSNVGKAIGAFERRLMTPGDFDALIAGDESAFSEQEKRGLALFVSTGCASCHYGESVGGERYAILGQVTAWPDLADAGRYDVTGVETDKYTFKVPGLRNIAETGPYLHDGSIESLEEIVRMMATHQLAREHTDDEVTDITAFLNALTGPLPTDYILVPEFPESSPDTPGPYEAEG